jgi:SET domain-containing protein
MATFESPATMLLVRTYLYKSTINGLGVFAGEFIRKGTKVWRFVAGFDRSWSPRDFAKLPKQAQNYVLRYGYRVDGEVLLTCDHDHHMNHSTNSNTYWRNGHIVARRNIAKGDEITNDYRMLDAAFCAAFLKTKAPIRRPRSRKPRAR